MVHRHRDLVELLEALPQPDRSIVTLHAQGFGYKEIAEATGLTVAAVSMRLTRALRKLRKHKRRHWLWPSVAAAACLAAVLIPQNLPTRADGTIARVDIDGQGGVPAVCRPQGPGRGYLTYSDSKSLTPWIFFFSTKEEMTQIIDHITLKTI